MNFKRFVLALLAVFFAIWLTDILIHGVWLKGDYQATMSLWRPEPEMHQRISWMFLGQLLAAVTFTMLWAKGFAAKACPRCAVLYGLFMGLFSQANTLITYVVQPLPADLAVKWFIAGASQGVLLGVLVYFVYPPSVAKEPPAACPV